MLEKLYTRAYSVDMNGLLTTAQAAEKLGVTRWRVNQLIQHGRLRATRMGQIFVIKEHDLKAVENRKPGRPSKVKEQKGRK